MNENNRFSGMPIKPIDKKIGLDNIISDNNIIERMINDVMWNVLMDMLSVCSMCEEKSVLKEIEKLNKERVRC